MLLSGTGGAAGRQLRGEFAVAPTCCLSLSLSISFLLWLIICQLRGRRRNATARHNCVVVQSSTVWNSVWAEFRDAIDRRRPSSDRCSRRLRRIKTLDSSEKSNPEPPQTSSKDFEFRRSWGGGKDSDIQSESVPNFTPVKERRWPRANDFCLVFCFKVVRWNTVASSEK